MAQTASPDAAPESEVGGPDAAEAARILAAALQDPEARAALIAKLQAAAETTPPAPPPESFDATLTRAVADRTLGVAQNLASGALDLVDAVSDWEAIAAQAAALDWTRIADAAIAVGAVMFVTLGLFSALRRVTRGVRTRISGGEGSRALPGKVAGLGAVGAFDLLLILLAWSAGCALALWGVGAATSMDVRQSLFLNAFLVVEVGRLILRLAFAAGRPALRLPPMNDTAANQWYVHVARIFSVLGYGMLLAVPVVRSAVSLRPGDLLALAVAAFAAAMAVRLILRNRLAVRRALMSRSERKSERGGQREGGRDGVVNGALGVLAQVWHLLAIAYVFGLFVVWTTRPADSLGFMVSATLRSALAIIVGTVAMVAIGRWIAGGVKLSDNLGMRLPLLEARLNAFVPNVLSAVRLLLFLAVIGAVLEVWGVFDATGWLAGETGQRVVRSLVSASLILLASAAIWVGVASWIEYKVTPQDGRVVRPRERTLLALLRNAFTVVLVVMATMLTLSALGLNIAPLLAGAGVIGLAIGFGAQRLVQDIITGVFIQFENAMNTGDVVTAAGITGTVEKLTIRSVGLRDTFGTFHVIPFSAVAAVSNFTKDFAYHIAEVSISPSENPAEAKAAMTEAFDDLRRTEHARSILGPFELQGLVQLADASMVLRARIKTVAGAQWAVGRAYTEIAKAKLDTMRRHAEIQPAPNPPPGVGDAASAPQRSGTG